MGFEAGAREGVDEGGVGMEGVVAERVAESEEEEAEREVGGVAKEESDLGEFGGSEAGGEEREDFVPAGLGAVVLQD